IMASSISKDPVCGMSVSAETKHRYVHDGIEYLFCCSRCRDRFAENPSNFLRPPTPQPAKAPVRPQSIYTCPMHPQVRQPGPGSCPLSGMTLEPLSPAIGAEENRELREMSKRLWFSAALTAPLVIAVMGEMIFTDAFSSLLSPRSRVWLELALA